MDNLICTNYLKFKKQYIELFKKKLNNLECINKIISESRGADTFSPNWISLKLCQFDQFPKLKN